MHNHTDLLATVEMAANRLVEDLRRAQHRTHDWTDERLTELSVEAALASCLARLTETGCWGEANRLPSGRLWQIAGPLLEVGVLQYHARSKPFGYAGDHQMLSRIWDEWCCDHPLGKAFDRYFVRQAAPEAVRARFQHIAATMAVHCLDRSDTQYAILSVGSGPGIEVSEALSALPDSRRSAVRVGLLDLDPQALDFARRRVEPLLPPGAVSSLRTNLYRLPQGELLGNADFLVCAGLFDYLADEPAAAMLKLFWQRLKPGGLMMVGNFAPHNPTRAYMEWIGNWYLLYRTPEAFTQLGLAAGIPADHFAIGSDRTGIDLFLTAWKP